MHALYSCPYVLGMPELQPVVKLLPEREREHLSFNKIPVGIVSILRASFQIEISVNPMYRKHFLPRNIGIGFILLILVYTVFQFFGLFAINVQACLL